MFLILVKMPGFDAVDEGSCQQWAAPVFFMAFTGTGPHPAGLQTVQIPEGNLVIPGLHEPFPLLPLLFSKLVVILGVGIGQLPTVFPDDQFFSQNCGDPGGDIALALVVQLSGFALFGQEQVNMRT